VLFRSRRPERPPLTGRRLWPGGLRPARMWPDGWQLGGGRETCRAGGCRLMVGDPAPDPRHEEQEGAKVFEAERPRLTGLAYRITGSLADADDVVQEAWLRFARAGPETVDRPAAWLTTVVARVALDH